MRLRLRIFGLATCIALAWPVRAQQLIGYVNTRDAEITGASDVLDGRAVLTVSAGVTARDHTAPITLGRGGTVRVCQTSVLHLSESRSANIAAPLLFSLDRGAIEIQMMSTLSDAIMTPDLRFAVEKAGPLDLRLRVARNGDTCVENRGAAAPTLNISDPFGEAMYQVAAGQHVLFEHGNLREVVDHEQSPCGCPDEKGMSVADALLASGSGKAVAPVAAAQPAVKAAEEHPFPAAISEGLAPEAEVPQAAPGAVHAQIADSLSYNASASAPAASVSIPAPAAVAQPAAKPPSKDLAHVLGRFFKRLFGG